jgi:hypothetical protein
MRATGADGTTQAAQLFYPLKTPENPLKPLKMLRILTTDFTDFTDGKKIEKWGRTGEIADGRSSSE